MEKTYTSALRLLIDACATIPNTRFMAVAKINALVQLNMRYEQVLICEKLTEHPFQLVDDMVRQALDSVRGWERLRFIEEPGLLANAPEANREEMHKGLFQMLWTQFNAEEYQERIARYTYRLRVNGLGPDFLRGKRCIDFGCGHGNFVHALVQMGAQSALGFDFGPDSVRFATEARNALGIDEDTIRFVEASVYQAPSRDGEFDLAVQNGVFHHLDDEDKAYAEVHRSLKTGGWFWVYTDGAGAISHDLWDASREILKNIPPNFIHQHLASLGLCTGKRYHLGDGLNAIYRHTRYQDFLQRLSGYGFGHFRRLVGGYDTDFDHDAISRHQYGPDKFGDGDIRILCQKL